MIIQEIIAIAGKPGLFRIVVTNRNNLIVESMIDKKRLSIPGTSRISSLADITMFTTGEDLLLMEVLNRMNEHIGDSDMPDIKGDASATKSFVDGVIPELDHGRVYNSDLKKLVQWFSILKSNDCFPLESQKDEETTTEAAAEEASTEEKEPKAKKAPAKKTAAKKAPAKKAATKKTAAPKAAAKKSTAKKSPASKAKK
jgi:cobalamin-dependent methionine synthase I